MSRDAELAFAHPEERAKATAPDGVRDRLSLRNHIVDVEIGAFQAERDMTQRVAFDVVVEVDVSDADLEDDVDSILSYDRITWAIEHELAAERLNLLETLAERIADRILFEPQARRVFVRIQKLDKGNGALGVEIERVPGQGGPLTGQTVQPVVAYLSNAALASRRLPGWIEQLAEQAKPLVLCLDLPEAAHAPVQTDAQRHIDLLSIEQSAWRLAAKFGSLTVAATRTELDWAMKNNLATVWAPSKLVLDATEEVPNGPKELAYWFAELWDAEHLILIGEEPLDQNTIHTQIVTLDQSSI